MERLAEFTSGHIATVNDAVAMAEEMVSNEYKMSASQWLRRKYDVKTLTDLNPDEIVDGPFAQLVRYEGQRNDSLLGSASFDFYKICLQDHAILSALSRQPFVRLLPFSLYIVMHELIHIVRFSMFLQSFEASLEEMMAEEKRVHRKTHAILTHSSVEGLSDVFLFFDQWRIPFDDLKDR